MPPESFPRASSHAVAAPILLRRYRPPDELRESLRHRFPRSWKWGVRHTVVDWLLISLAILFSESTRGMGLWFEIPAYLLALIVIGSRQRALTTILHDASHRHFARGFRINFLLGTFFSGYPVLYSFTGYVNSHVRAHHGYFGDEVRDPDYRELLDYYSGRIKVDTHFRLVLAIASPLASLRYVMHLVQHRIVPPGESSLERWTRLAYLVLLIGVFAYLGLLTEVLFYWVVPMLTTGLWIGRLLEISEHFPLMRGAERSHLSSTRNRISGPLLGALLGIHSENYHLVHHLFPGVPSYHHRAFHKLLMCDPAYADESVNDTWPRIVQSICEYSPAPSSEDGEGICETRR